MVERVDDSAGVAHLEVLARLPRAAGSDEERSAREYCAGVLRALGFVVELERFEYSAFPGRYGTPVGGVIALVTALATSVAGGIYGAPRAAAFVFGAGLALLSAYTWRMLGNGVLDLPLMRATGENLVARRGPSAPRVWLVAHVDTKSQPIPSRTRVLGVVLLAGALLVDLAAIVVTLGGGGARTVLWLLAVGLAGAGSRGVVFSVVRNESPGAVDNASGVASVLEAAALLDGSAPVGVLVTSAEELGLAGARAWVRAHGAEPAFVLNCDGVDDQGELTLMYTRRPPVQIVGAVREAAAGEPRVRRMPPGLLLDSVAFADAGWSAATLSHGSLGTLARVHTRRDSLELLRGRSVGRVARVLARAAEALAR